MSESRHPLDYASDLRGRWLSREPTFGGWVHIKDSFSAEIVARAGFDWVCIDTQHGMARAGDLVPLLQAAGLAGCAVVVRVPWNEPGVIMNALDAGASGVIVPMVNSAAEARQAVDACRYPPLGSRSWGPSRVSLGASGYSAEWANERVLCIVMVETPEGVDYVDDILAVDGVDCVFIGPMDLALSYGVGRDEPAHMGRVATMRARCEARGVPVGIALKSADEARRAAAEGFSMIALPSDAVLLMQGCAALLAAVRDKGKPTPNPRKP